MRKLLMMLLTTGLLVPSSILANDGMESMPSEDFEEMSEFSEETALTSLNEPSIMPESASTNCTVKFQINGTSTSSTVIVQNNVLSVKDQALAFYKVKDLLPSAEYGYGFSMEPKDISLSENPTPSITLKALTFEEIANATTFDTKVPIHIQYSLPKELNSTFSISLENWDEMAKDSTTMTKEALNKKLASAGYTTSKAVTKNDLIPIYYGQSNKVVPFYYLLESNNLEKIKVSNLLNNSVQVNFSKNSLSPIECTFLIGDLSPNSETGQVDLTAEILEKALNQMSSRSGDKVKFSVTKTGNRVIKTFSVYNLTDLTLTSADLTEVNITMDFTSSTSGFLLQIQGPETQAPVLLKRYVSLSEIDTNGTTNGEDKGKISAAEMEKFLTNNYKKLKYVAQGFTPIDLTKVDFLAEGLIPIRSVRLGYQNDVPRDVLMQENFTLKFVDSTQDQVVDTTTKTWARLFSGSSQITLTKSLVAGDVLPRGYGIAPVQKPKSTTLSKKELGKNELDGDFSISVYGPNEVTIYVTKREGTTSTDKNDGHIATKPTPSEPTVPVVPEQPQQPTFVSSQGKQSMFRLYNTQTHEHFYTRSAEEKAKLLAEGTWSDEGHGWNAPAISSYTVYRLFNPNTGEHHYTKDKNEYDTLIRYGWNGEGHAFYSADDANNKVTIYRLYNSHAPQVAQHHYTTSEKERDELIKDGWKFEGTAWFGMPTE